MKVKYFFDIPVYRLERDKYCSQRDAYIDKNLYQVGSTSESYRRKRDKENPNENIFFRDHFWNSYGGCWEFNEIIGYIRLHFLGSQVRGEYFGVSASRIVRTRKKVYKYQTHKLAAEVATMAP